MKIRAMTSIFIVLAALACGPGLCEEVKTADPNQLFYQGNTYYQARNYTDALLAYDKILDMGIESGNLYYNIGNSFFKTGKLGYAILFYERAREIIPYDSDLRSNLDFARSMVNEPSTGEFAENSILKALKRPYRDFSLSALAIIALGMYIFMILLIALNIVNPMVAKRVRFIIGIIIIVGLYTISVFCIRYYSEEIRKRGVILVKEAECKYEPIDKSAIFYKLREGAEVIVLTTRDGWRQIRRADGKIGWVNRQAVEPI